MTQADVTTACLVQYMQSSLPDLLPPGSRPRLEALAARMAALPAFAKIAMPQP